MSIFSHPEFAAKLVPHISRSELVNLAIINHIIADVYRPYLFERITLTLSGPLLHWAMHEDVRFLHDRPHLAHLISDLTIDGSRHAGCCSFALVAEIMLSCSRVYSLTLQNLRWCLDKTPALPTHLGSLRSLYLLDIHFSRVTPLQLLLLSTVWFTVELTYCDMFAFLLPLTLPAHTVIHNLGIFGLQATRRHPRVLRAPNWLSKLVLHSLRVAIDDAAIHELAIVLQGFRTATLTMLSFVQPADEDQPPPSASALGPVVDILRRFKNMSTFSLATRLPTNDALFDSDEQGLELDPFGNMFCWLNALPRNTVRLCLVFVDIPLDPQTVGGGFTSLPWRLVHHWLQHTGRHIDSISIEFDIDLIPAAPFNLVFPFLVSYLKHEFSSFIVTDMDAQCAVIEFTRS